MAIEKGNKIKVEYIGTLDDGTIFDSSEGREPLEFEAGSGQVIKGFDDAVIGMEKGEEKTIKIVPENAYGNSNPDFVRKVPREQFPTDKKVEAGMMIGLGTPDGRQFPAVIKEVTDTEITLDLNHPLAGKTLNFKIKIIDYN